MRLRQPKALSACDPASCDLRASISAAKKLDQGEQLGALADNG